MLETMKTFTTKQDSLIQIENPLNLIFLLNFTSTRITAHTIREHKEGFEYAHGIVHPEELKKEVKKGSDIYISSKKKEAFKIQTKILKGRIFEFLDYNKIPYNIKDECYKTGEECIHNCKAQCKESC